MFKHLLNRAVLLAIFVSGWISCSDPGFTAFDSNEKDAIVREFAASFNEALSKAEFRVFLKESVLSRFDGDYNFLVHQFLSYEVQKNPNGTVQTFANYVFGNSKDQERSIDFLKKNVPLLQIAIPELSHSRPDDWDANSFRPAVAFTNQKIKSGKIEAINNRGHFIELSATEEPGELTIVLSENERMLAVPKGGSVSQTNARTNCDIMLRTSNSAYYSNEYYDYYFLSSLNNCGGGGGGYFGGGGGGGSGPALCDRDTRANKDELVRMKFVDMDAFRRAAEWFDGGLDIEVTITFATPNGAITKVTKSFSGPDRDFKDCPFPGFSCSPAWKGINAEIVTWDKAIYGNAMHYFWNEKDSGENTTVSSTFSTAFDNPNGTKSTVTTGLSFTVTVEDDLLGESIVEYCDQANGDGFQYSTGRVYFNVREK